MKNFVVFLRMQNGSNGGFQFPQAAQLKVILLLSGCNRPKLATSFENTSRSKVMLWLPNIGSSWYKSKTYLWKVICKGISCTNQQSCSGFKMYTYKLLEILQNQLPIRAAIFHDIGIF